MSDTGTTPLLAIAVALRKAGMQVSVGDILEGIDALAGLDAPFVTLAPVATSTRDRSGDEALARRIRRERLIWLIQALWARTDEERQTVRRVLGQAIAPPPSNRILELGQVVAGLPRASDAIAPESPRPPPSDPLEDLTRPKPDPRKKKKATAKTAASEGEDRLGPTGGDGTAPDFAPPEIRLPVPVIDDTTLPRTHGFQMEAPPALDELAMSAIWRRLRNPRLLPDRNRLDVRKTVEATVRAGGFLTLQTAMRRVNQARLTLMLDVSTAMVPWADWTDLFRRTADPDVSRLDAADIGYFATMPGAHWYDDPEMSLEDPDAETDLGARLKALAGRPMLVLGEAGAARAPMANMARRLESFLTLTRQNDIRPLIWINPMRRSRWQPAFVNDMVNAPHADAMELSHQSLITAIDRMREEAP